MVDIHVVSRLRSSFIFSKTLDFILRADPDVLLNLGFRNVSRTENILEPCQETIV